MMKLCKIKLFALMIISFFGCTKDVDFDQADDVLIENSFLFTLAHFEIQNNDFIDEGIEVDNLIEIIELPIDNGSEDNLVKVIFEVVTDNSFKDKFTLQINFLDQNLIPFYQLNPIVEIPSGSENLVTLIEIPLEDIHNIYQMTYTSFLVTKLPDENSTLPNNDNALFKVRSSFELFFNFQ